MENPTENNITSWIEQSIEDENFVEREIAITGESGKSDGYTGDIIFAKVSGVDAARNPKEIHLAIKIANQSEARTKQLPATKEFYMRETSIYGTIFPAFEKFQKEKNIADGFDSVPKCYKTIMTDSTQVVVLEDLKIKGYKLHDRTIPMNFQHIKLVLDSYAKFHAISFAFRDQKAEEYKALTSNYYRHIIRMFEDLLPVMQKAKSNVVKNLIAASREDLVEKYEAVFENNSMLDILKEEVEHPVITHGDCHNNNFLFQYKGDDGEAPTKVAILDWQIASQHSPVVDLSYFLYPAAGRHIYEVRDLLEFYYARLSQNAKDMGTDLSVTYPFASLLADWRKYSFYGFVYTATFLELYYVKEQDVPNEGDDDVMFFTKVELENREGYWKRLIDIIDHFCNHQI